MSTLPTKKKEPKKKKVCLSHCLLATFVAPRRYAPILVFLYPLLVLAPLIARIAPISFNPYAAPIPCLFSPILIPMCGEHALLPLPVFRFFSYSHCVCCCIPPALADAASTGPHDPGEQRVSPHVHSHLASVFPAAYPGALPLIS